MFSGLAVRDDNVAMYTEHTKLTYDAANISDGVWRVTTRHAAKYRQLESL